MKKRALSLIGATAGAALVVWGLGERVQLVEAADHADGIDAMNTEASDITDNYSWVWDDNGTPSLALVMNITAASFADNIQYAWTLVRDPLGTPTVSQMICQFNSTAGDDISCFYGDAADFTEATGDPSGATGFSQNGIRVFAGERDDPFFFNADGFTTTVEAVRTQVDGDPDNGELDPAIFDDNGCPDLVAAGLDGAIAACLTTSCDNGLGNPATNPPVNAFTGSVQSLVVSIPLAMIPGTTDVLAVSASTHVAP